MTSAQSMAAIDRAAKMASWPALAVFLLLVCVQDSRSGQQWLSAPPLAGSTPATHAHDSEWSASRLRAPIALACVVCKDRLHEALTMVKSAILMTHSPLKVLAFVDPELSARFKVGLDALVRASAVSVAYELLPPNFPERDASEWREMYLPCTTQRLFVPELLVDEDAVIYADTDTLFLGPLEDVWAQLAAMRGSQLAALAPENVGLGATYEVAHPYFGQGGLNAGVMLMNLTRMRAVKFTQLAVKVQAEFRRTLVYADQGILNVIFHFHPNWLLALPCRFNFKHRQCELGCASALQHGIAILHGHTGSFHTGRVPGVKAVFDAFSAHRLGADPLANLIVPMRRNLELARGTYCGNDRNVEIFMRSVAKHLLKHPLGGTTALRLH